MTSSKMAGTQTQIKELSVKKTALHQKMTNEQKQQAVIHAQVTKLKAQMMELGKGLAIAQKEQQDIIVQKTNLEKSKLQIEGNMYVTLPRNA